VVIPDEGPLSIGRSSESDLQLLDLGVSRFHCVVEAQAENLVVTDLSSSNGTFVNGHRVKRQVLARDDEITIGPVTLVVEQLIQPPRPGVAGLLPGDDGGGERVVVPSDIGGSTELVLPVLESPAAAGGGLAASQGADTERLRRDLEAVCRIGDQIHAQESLDRILTLAVETVLDVVNAERGCVVLKDQDTGELRPAVLLGSNAEGDTGVSVSQPLVNDCMERGVGVLCRNLRTDEQYVGPDQDAESRSVLCTPLNVAGKVLGALYLDTPTEQADFDEHDLELLKTIARQAALALHRAQLVENLERLFLGSIETLVATVEAKDIYTYGHSARVSKLARLTAERLGRPKAEVEQIKIAGLLHDIGKIGIPESILGKETHLTFEEWAYVRSHPEIGESIIRQMGSDRLEGVQQIVRHHHERLDGSGYPDGLKGDAIPFGACVLAVADTYDAITSNRPYRTPHTPEEAVTELWRHAGTRFRTDIVEAFVEARAERLAGPSEVNGTGDALTKLQAAPPTKGR
jgi:putative nucleotidyltransferase with HDIG domain